MLRAFPLSVQFCPTDQSCKIRRFQETCCRTRPLLDRCFQIVFIRIYTYTVCELCSCFEVASKPTACFADFCQTSSYCLPNSSRVSISEPPGLQSIVWERRRLGLVSPKKQPAPYTKASLILATNIKRRDHLARFLSLVYSCLNSLVFPGIVWQHSVTSSN